MNDHHFVLEISPDEKMLAFSIYLSNKLTIFNVVTKRIVKELKLDFSNTKFKFSNDSNFIFFGDDSG